MKYFADFDHGFSEIQLTKVRNDYANQKSQCKNKLDANKNPVKMLLTFSEWLKIWIDSGKLSERGLKKGQYCMCRIDDIGHYEIGNVFIDLHANNTKFATSGDKNYFYGKDRSAMNHPNFGKSFPPEKNGKFKGTTIATCIKTGKQIRMNGMKEMIQNGFNPGHVSECIRGNRKKHHGHSFIRIDI